MNQNIGSALDDLCISENGRIGQKRRNNKDSNEPYKSKNLFAERNRREKLHNRLMDLRGLVPNITNMKKATIVEDAIDHIKNLEETIADLKDQLFYAESLLEDESIEPNIGQIDHSKQDFNETRIEPDISVVQINENKLWIKAMFEKKRGGFTKFIEALSALGFEIGDTSLTSHNEAILVTSSVEGYPCESLAVQEIKEILVQIVKGQYI